MAPDYTERQQSRDNGRPKEKIKVEAVDKKDTSELCVRTLAKALESARVH